MSKVRNIFAYILGAISAAAFFLASGIRDVADWYRIARPYFVVGIVTLILSVILYKWHAIRRITYPAIICVWAWLYAHKIVTSKFSNHTYRVFVYFGRSYRKLYEVVQIAFDQYSANVNKV